MATNGNLGSELEGFFISLGFSVDDGEVKRMAATVTETVGIMRRLVTVAGVAATAITALVGHSAAEAEELGDFAVANNVSAEAVQELGFAAADTGSSLDAVKSSIEGLNRVTGEAALGIGRGEAVFKKLGLSAKDSTGQVKTFDVLIADVADKMQGLSLQESVALASKIGIDPSLVRLLREGSGAIESLREEARSLGITTDAQIEQAGAVVGATRRVMMVITATKNEIAAGLFPVVARLLTEFREWVQVNRAVIRSGFSTAIKIFSGVLGALWRVARATVSSVIDLVQWASQFKIAVIGATAAVAAFISIGTARVFGTVAIAVYSGVKALMAFNVAALLTPALIGAIILAVGLLIEDFLVWREGGESLIGEMLEGFPKAVDEIKAFFAPVQAVIGFFGQAFDAAEKFGDYIRNDLFGALGDLGKRALNLAGLDMNATATAAPVGASMFAGGGVLGTAPAASVNDSSTTIQELNISVISSDPARAGESVVAELDKRGMIMTRNAQSGLAL